MGDDLNLMMGGVKVYLGEQELGEMQDIILQPDDKLPKISVDYADRPLRAIEPPEGGITCEVKLHPAHRPRWRQILRAYKLMRTDALQELVRGKINEARTKEGALLVKMGSSLGKSDAPLEIIGYVDNNEGGNDNETLLHLTSVHG